MGDLEERKRWRTERVEARLWYCGDGECACTQPVIERITPNLDVGYPWIRRETIWEGQFLSGTWGGHSWEEREERQFAPARAACRERGVPIPEDFGTDPGEQGDSNGP